MVPFLGENIEIKIWITEKDFWHFFVKCRTGFDCFSLSVVITIWNAQVDVVGEEIPLQQIIEIIPFETESTFH